MYKILRSDKDTYITDRVIKNSRVYNSNVGKAGSIDLFKIYGSTFTGETPNIELSRALIHFDMSPVKDLFSSGKLDPSHHSFFATLNMTDVYGGQPTPSKFNLIISPLSMSFEEGGGKDVTSYTDLDVSNFLTASYNNVKWMSAGCNESGSLGSFCDFFTGSIQVSQYFPTGEEDLCVDVTKIVSGVLCGEIPDEGFRISFSQLEENDNRTYFVKRFASRHAFDETKRPRLVVGIDDSIQDTTQGMTLDSEVTSFLFNYDKGQPKNLSTSGGEVTGPDCLALTLKLPISGGHTQYVFTGSQHYVGALPMTGIYSASLYLSSADAFIKNALNVTGSVNVTPIWTSLDGSTVFLTGSVITARAPLRGSSYLSPKKFIVTGYGLKEVHRPSESVVVKINIFDYTSPLLKVVKTPVDSPGVLQGVVSDAFYSVKDHATGKTVIPFDDLKGSTRLSSDTKTMFFVLDMSNFTPERSYVIDVMLKVGDEKQIHQNVSTVFKISNF